MFLLLPAIIAGIVLGVISESQEDVCRCQAAGRAYTYHVIGGCQIIEPPKPEPSAGGDL